jgi:ABC-type bacteriocin/lantibiotic exporter with double-glycine peptidase domain
MKYQTVLQHSEEDCGAACIATVAKHYGRTFSISRVRECVGTGARGTTLLGLRRGAEALGFNVRQAQASEELLESLGQLPLPAIIHWKGIHWVVLYGQRRKEYVVADPGVGIRYLSRRELLTGWSDGIMLLLMPDDSRFYHQSNDKIDGLGRFLIRVWPYRSILLTATAINIAVGLLSLASPIMMQLLTDDVLVRGDMQLLTTVAIGVISLSIISTAIGLVQSFLIGHFGQRLQLGLILEYGRQLLHLPLSYFEGRRSGEVVSRISDVHAVNNLVGQIVLGLPSQFFIAIISLGLMLFYSWQLTIASILVFILITAVNLLFLPALRQKTRSLIVEGTENQGFLVETFRGVQILKTTQATPQAWDEYQNNFGRLASLEWGTMKLELFSGTITNILSTLTNVGLLWLGSYLVIDKTLSIGQLMAYHGMSSNFLGFLSQVVSLFDEFVTAKIVIQRLTEVIDTPLEDENDTQKSWIQIQGNFDVTCIDVNYHHSGRVDLLKDFSLTIPGGSITALIGQSGCGKSTLAKMVSGLYFPNSGNIRYGPYNQRDISLECLRQQIVLVPQEPHFWSRSIVANFRLSYPQISFEEIVMACQIAGADEFIGQLPEQYQTILGEFGANLSGGQRQRLAIARAIAIDPPVLILDESTGALDPVSEAQVLEQLLTYRQDKTTILISHRPKVISRADWIVFLENGQLKICGTPQELIHQPGNHLDFLDDMTLLNHHGRALGLSSLNFVQSGT